MILFFVYVHANEGNIDGTIHGQDGYYELGKSLIAGKGFSWDGVLPSPFHVPLFPLFLAVSLFLSGSLLPALGLQMILGAIVPVLGRRISLKLISSEKIGFWIGLTLALEPNFILHSFIFYSETLFLFLFSLFILSFISYLEKKDVKILCLSAFLLGISVLTKTVVQFLPILLIPLMWWFLRKDYTTKKIAIHSALFVAIFILAISPWFYRNYRTFDTISTTVMPTYNLYSCFVPSVLAIANRTSFAEEQKNFTVGKPNNILNITFANTSVFNREALETIKKYPLAILEVSAINVLTFFTHDGILTVIENAGIHPKSYLSKPAIILLFSSPYEFVKVISKYLWSPFVLVLIMRLFWIAITATFLWGIIVLMRKKEVTAYIAFALVLVAYFALTTPSNGLCANGRFRMPVEPVILAVSYYGIYYSLLRFGKKGGTLT